MMYLALIMHIGAVSSAGRASVLQTGGHRFESCTAHQLIEINTKFAIIMHRLKVL